ncbi:MAG: ParA family protein, partial [Deltaproteobacteria bacterium]|nr:ParA family protein [Deltaproteobacteria bacterium]
MKGGAFWAKQSSCGATKGGVGKTMTAASLGFGLARQGKRVLLLDCDSQHSLTVSL